MANNRIRRRTPAPKIVKVEEKEERDPSVPQYGPYDVLQYHSGSKGRREFFRIQKAAHARPALSEETCLKMEDDPTCTRAPASATSCGSRRQRP